MNDTLSKTLAVLAVLSLVIVPLLTGGAAAAEKGRVVTPLGKNLDGWQAKGPIEQSKWAVGLAKVDPNNPRSHYYLALIYVNEGANEEAKGHLERFIQLAPDDPDAGTAGELLEYLSDG